MSMYCTIPRVSNHFKRFILSVLIAASLLFTPSLYGQWNCGTPPADLFPELSDLFADSGVPFAPPHAPPKSLHKIRVVYFVPKDRENRIKEVRPKIRQNLEETLAFFAEQRKKLDFGTKDIEVFGTDDDPLEIQTIIGKYDHAYYEKLSWAWSTGMEIAEHFIRGELSFDPRYSIVLMFLEKDTADVDGAGGIGGYLPPEGGMAWFGVSGERMPHWTITAHEIGHALGLVHNFNSPLFMMSYGWNPDRLAWVHGQFLNTSRYLNDFPSPNNAENTSIEIADPIPFTYDAQTDKTRLIFRVQDADGISQILFLPATGVNSIGAAPDHPEVYWNNEGRRNGQRTVRFTVDFFADAPPDNPLSFEKGGDGINPIWQDRWGPVQRHRGRAKGVEHPLMIQVIDQQGFITRQSFDLRERSTESSSLAVEATGKFLTTWGAMKADSLRRNSSKSERY